jgi:hypothetical protein
VIGVPTPTYVGQGGRTELPTVTVQLSPFRSRRIEQAGGEVSAGIALYDTGAHPSRREGFGVKQRVPGLAVLLERSLGPRHLLTSSGANISSPGCEL